MAEIKSTITLREYIEKLYNDGHFVIPDYQRGYIWGQYNPNHASKDGQDSVSYLVCSILSGYKENRKDVFLQGITVHTGPSTHDITLVDGQQRTTFFYLLLKYLGFADYIAIKYEIRGNSDIFLSQLNVEDCEENEEEPYQDIYFFKKTLRTFKNLIKDEDKNKLLEYVLDHVRFLYINIPPEKAKLVFSMMNGNKAIMLQEELIKSELLRCSSVNTDFIKEAENISIRNRFAHEWDKWLYWWNDKDVKKYFKCDRQLGWLLPLTANTERVSFEDFKEKCIGGQNVREAKASFRKMRLLQKSIEDAYNAPLVYNLMGAILCIRYKSERFEFLKWYFDLVGRIDHTEAYKELRRYFDWACINMTHKEIIDKNIDAYNERRLAFLEALKMVDLYRNGYETGARWLLRCNILEDCSQNKSEGRKFNYAIWEERSLEHIYPKSKVLHYESNMPLNYDDNPIPLEMTGNYTLNRESIVYHKGMPDEVRASEHSIGNLVLLYKNDNSKFNAADFEQKKSLYFTIKDDSGFQSRHLLHTVSVFASSKWDGKDIAQHYVNEINRFNSEYTENYES
jgi:hypothetical protein